MKEVRASVCCVRAFSATSRQPGILLIGRRIESLGHRDGRDGSNVSMSSTGLVTREASGETRWEFALERPVIYISISAIAGNTKIRAYIASQLHQIQGRWLQRVLWCGRPARFPSRFRPGSSLDDLELTPRGTISSRETDCKDRKLRRATVTRLLSAVKSEDVLWKRERESANGDNAHYNRGSGC